jgi:hypothetical protein
MCVPLCVVRQNSLLGSAGNISNTENLFRLSFYFGCFTYVNFIKRGSVKSYFVSSGKNPPCLYCSVLILKFGMFKS